MLHPIIESLLFLKLARNSVTEAIYESGIEEAVELVNYIQNEASDYEVMHLITLGEMPENKFDDESESVVWECFKRDMVMSYNYFIEEGYDSEDIDTIIFEMDSIADLGLSSAAPVMELHQNNGYYKQVLEEWGNETLKDKFEKKRKQWDKKIIKKRNEKSADWVKDSIGRRIKKTFGRSSKMDDFKTGAEDKATQVAAKWAMSRDARKKKIKKGKASIADKVITGVETPVAAGAMKFAKARPTTQVAVAGVGGAALAAGAGYLGYKLYKKLKEKFSKEKDPEKKAKLKAKMAKLKAKK